MIEIKYEDLFAKRQEEGKKPEETGRQEPSKQGSGQGEGPTPERLCLHFSDEFMDSIKRQGKPVE